MDDFDRIARLSAEGAQYTYENFAPRTKHGYPGAPLPSWVAWSAKVQQIVSRVCGSDSAAARAADEAASIPVQGNGNDHFERAKSLFMGALQVAQEDAQRALTQAPPRPNVETTLVRIFDRFHMVARQLRDRHDARPTLDINDEYDVQDLMHALLKLEFDDIRPEEWTPSYAGGASRTDFLLKKENVFIEIKKTRNGMSKRELGDQLIIDIARYQAHPACRALYCFIYDPEGRVGNPVGLETDLSRNDPMPVRAYVRPGIR